MAQFKKLIVTKKGQEAINDSLTTSKYVTFTKICSSTKVYKEDVIPSLTELDDVKQTVEVTKTSKINDNTIQIESTINNDEIKEGYSLNSLGLFINYNDKEILYGVASVESSDKGSYIPPFNDKVPTGVYLKLISTLTNTSTVIFNIDPSGQATIGDILRIDEEIKELTEKIPDDYITINVDNLTNYELKTNTGSKLSLTIDPSTYVMTIELKNSDDKVISSGEIDLPLETMVVNATYDSKTKEIVLTLQSGTETRFSVADLVSGLVTTEEYNKLKEVVTSDVRKSYDTTLIVNNWVQNEASYFEYDVVKSDITSNTDVDLRFSIEDQEKFTGRVDGDSYDGGFKIRTTEKPEGDVDVTVVYGLTNINLGGIQK